MADQLRIEIDVAAAKAGLDSLSQSFANFKTSATNNVSGASAAIQKLNSAMGQLKALDAGVLSSLTNLNSAIANLNAGNLSTVANALNALNGASGNVKNTSDAVASLGKALEGVKAPPGVDSVKVSFSGLGQAAHQADAHVRAFAKSQAQTQAAIKGLGTELLNVGGYMAGLGVSAGNIITKFQQLSANGTSLSQIFAGMQQSLGGLGASVAVVAALGAALTGLYTVGKSLIAPILEVGIAFNNFKIAIDAIDGSGAGAKTMEALQGVAQRTGQNILTLTKSFVGFRTAAESAGVSARDSVKIYEQFSVGLRALGADSQKTEKAFLALTQMFSKGKVQAEELRGQLGDALPGALGFAAKAIGVTTAELDAMLKAGTVMADDLIPKLGEFLQVKFGDAVAKQVDSAIGQMGLFQTAVANLVNSVAQGLTGGVMQGFARGLAELNKALDSAALRAFAAAIGDLAGAILAIVGGALGGFIQGLTGVVDVVVDVAEYFLQFSEAGRAIIAVMQENGVVMGAFATAAKAVGTVLGVMASVWVTSKVAALAYSAAVAVATAGGHAYTAAVTRAATATTVLNVAMKGNAFIAVASAVVGVGVALYNAAGGIEGLVKSWGFAAAETEKAVKTTDVMTRSLEKFSKIASETPEKIVKQAQSYFTLEGAAQRVSRESAVLESKIKSLDQAQKQQTLGMEEARVKHGALTAERQRQIQSLEAEKTALQQNEMRWKDLGVSSSGTSLAMRAINEDIKASKTALEDSNIAFQERMNREKEFALSMKESEQALKDQKEALDSYGKSLDVSSLALAKQYEAFGLTREEAGKLAFAYQEGTRSLVEQANELDRQAAKKEEYIGFLKQQIGAVEASIAADVKALETSGRTREEIDMMVASKRVMLETLRGELGTTASTVAAQETYAMAIKEGISIQDAAEKVAKRLAETYGQQVDPVKLAGEAMKVGSTAAGNNATALNKAKDASGEMGASAKDTAESVKKAADESKKASENITQVGEAMKTAQASFTAAQTSLTSIASSLDTSAKSAGSLAIVLPEVVTQVTALSEAIPLAIPMVFEFVSVLGAMVEKAYSVQTILPLITASVGELATAATTAAPMVDQIAKSLEQVANTGAGITSAKDSMVAFIAILTDSAGTFTQSAEYLNQLATAGSNIKTGYDTAADGSGKFLSSLDAVISKVQEAITAMNNLKQAAEDALKAAQAASKAGETNSPGSREGGYSEENIYKSASIYGSELLNNAPKFAEGTTNTSKHLSKISGGGIPSILHPNEAVVPLSKGRKIPVDLSMPSIPSPAEMDARPFDSLASGLQGVVNAMEDVATAMRDTPRVSELTMPELTPTININIPEMVQSAPVIPPQAQQSSSGLFGPGASDGGGDTSSNDSRGTSDSGSQSAGNVTINFNVQAQDADSFNKSKDQILRDLSKSINKATRRVRSN